MLTANSICIKNVKICVLNSFTVQKRRMFSWEHLLHFCHWAHDDVNDAAARARDCSQHDSLRNVFSSGKTWSIHGQLLLVVQQHIITLHGFTAGTATITKCKVGLDSTGAHGRAPASR
jgi:hypothetical protein